MREGEEASWPQVEVGQLALSTPVLFRDARSNFQQSSKRFVDRIRIGKGSRNIRLQEHQIGSGSVTLIVLTADGTLQL